MYISGDALVDYRSIYRSAIGRLSVDGRSAVGRLSVNSQPIVDRYIGRLSAYMSTEATYSTHDPVVLGGFRPFHVSVLTLARVRLLYQ